MAIDTTNKRRAIQSLPGIPFVLPFATGEITESARAVLCGVYPYDFQETYNTPIFTLITNKITTLINTYMTQANGFSLDYGSINEYDPVSTTYPAVFYNYPDEDDLDSDFDVENRYSESTIMTFRVVAPTSTDLEITSDQVIADFNKLFAEFQYTLKKQGLIDYCYITSEKEKRPVKAYPIDLSMDYELKYRRVMDDIYAVDTCSDDDVFSGSAWSAMTPVWDVIIAQIETLIGTMTVSNGYNYDYGSIDDFDIDNLSYPIVYLKYPTENGLPEEDNEIQMYNITHDLMISVIAGTSSDLDKTTFLLRSDFNKMFAENREVLEAVGMDQAEYTGSSKAFRPVKATPVTINLNHTIHFSRQKKNPYLT